MQEVPSDLSTDQLTGVLETDPSGNIDDGEIQPTSTLIAFPGTNRPVPEWRKQLSQRVREVQEQRAREAAETAAATDEAEAVSITLPSAQLELVPNREQPALNPIVSKALERVDRARKGDFPVGYAATAAAPALAPVSDEMSEPEQTKLPLKPNLVMVAPARIRPARIISEDDDAALSYLDSYLTIPAIKIDDQNRASFTRRTVAAVLDLLLLGIVLSPIAALLMFAGADWSDPRIIAVMSASAIVLMFAYLTFSIAFTGRTLGMRWLSLRAIDIRTRLIPTGAQSIKRTIAYLVSIAPLGLLFIYALIDPDGRTLHDRFSQTIVVRA
jgi:uncharacterized RDD family membrane protein YckC